MTTPPRVMISLHVASMKDSALKIKNYLQSKQIDTWICTEMLGGVDYRTAIVDAIKQADVVIIMLNDLWALSGECYDEYSYAKRLNLTSHERGVTKRDQPRKPAFIPLAFSDLNWTAHKHVELLAASTNFIIHNHVNLLDGDYDLAISRILASFAHLGYNVPGLPQPAAKELQIPSVVQSSPYGGDSSSAGKVLADVCAKLTQLMHDLPMSNTVAPQRKSEIEIGTIKVGNRYLGNTAQDGKMNDGTTWFTWQSCELEILKYDPSTKRVEAKVTRKELSKKINGSTEVKNLPSNLVRYLQNFGESVEHCMGEFNSVTGLLSLEGVSIQRVSGQGTLWETKKYMLVAYSDKMIGPSTDLKLSVNNANSAANILQQF